MISFTNISKQFDGKSIITDISAIFEKGNTNLIIGKSGSGKTVLVKCLVGLIIPDRGEVHYGDVLFRYDSIYHSREIRRQIGMLFQGVALFDSKTVEENVEFPLDILTSMTSKEKRLRVDFCLDRVGLAGTNSKYPSELSGGMKKRVGIARAIVNSPQYLFCDEPNSGLDPQTAIRIDRLIHDITKENDITTVVVTHDMNSVIEMGDYVLFLHDGSKEWEGSKDEVLSTDSKPLREFIFASKLLRSLKPH